MCMVLVKVANFCSLGPENFCFVKVWKAHSYNICIFVSDSELLVCSLYVYKGLLISWPICIYISNKLWLCTVNIMQITLSLYMCQIYFFLPRHILLIFQTFRIFLLDQPDCQKTKFCIHVLLITTKHHTGMPLKSGKECIQDET